MVYSTIHNGQGCVVKHEVENLYVGRDNYWTRFPQYATPWTEKRDAEVAAKIMGDAEKEKR